MRRELLLGCGSRRQKLLYVDGRDTFSNVTTLDSNSSRNPDVLWDLRKHPLPFEDNMFDEIHAYQILEHLAYQGDYEFFFAEFSEYYRILKPEGFFCASVPKKGSIWDIGDPSHKRVIVKENLMFLMQDSYKATRNSSMSDFRDIYKADFCLIFIDESSDNFNFILKVIKKI